MPKSLYYLCVFCGSSVGQHPRFRQVAEELGGKLAAKKIGLVYGGAGIGLIGAVADAVLAYGGEAIGVMPQALVNLEVAHENLSQFYVVKTMHERKQKLYELSHAFVALPGGPGTMDEWFEILTWAQLRHHNKPIYILNIEIDGAGYFAPLIAQLNNVVKYGFMRAEHAELFSVVTSVDQLLDALIQSRN